MLNLCSRLRRFYRRSSTASDNDGAAAEAADMSCAFHGMPEADDDNVNLLKNNDYEQERGVAEAEVRDGDEILFRQPKTTHLGDCPICFLPLPLDPYKSTLQSCCSKVICKGCRRAIRLHEASKKTRHKCPLCRQPEPRSNRELNMNSMKRVAVNDRVAIQERGKKGYYDGHYKDAFKYWTEAAELGDVDSIYLLSLLYRDGLGVEKNEEKEWHQLEEAAIAGHVGARFTLAHNERMRRGNTERAVKHLIIAANLGCNYSIKALEQCHENGEVCKDQFTATLHAHEAAVDEMKSPQREEQANYARCIEEWFCAGK